jgi:hypothetical protein
MQEIVELRKNLANHGTANRTSDMKHILLKLRADLAPTEELLRETRIGLSVGKLRSHADKEISELAKGIVKKVCPCAVALLCSWWFEWRNDVGPTRKQESSVKNESAAPSQFNSCTSIWGLTYERRPSSGHLKIASHFLSFHSRRIHFRLHQARLRQAGSL